MGGWVSQVPGEAWCTWGTAKYVYQGFSGQTSNYSALSSTEASNLLDTSLWGSLLHSPASLDLWVSAARHLGVVPQLPLSKTRDKQARPAPLPPSLPPDSRSC